MELFNVLSTDEKVTLADVLVEVRYQRGDNIVLEGEPGDAFYILTEGKIEFYKKDASTSKGGEKCVHAIEARKEDKTPNCCS